MGRIKTKLIKRVSKEILVRYGSHFKSTFNENKEIIPKFAEIHSKKLRNILVGYITHLKRSKNDY